MTRKSFRRDLETLREDVVAMGDLARRQFEDAANALGAHDERLANEVIARDDTLNKLYLDLEGD